MSRASSSFNRAFSSRSERSLGLASHRCNRRLCFCVDACQMRIYAKINHITFSASPITRFKRENSTACSG